MFLKNEIRFYRFKNETRLINIALYFTDSFQLNHPDLFWNSSEILCSAFTLQGPVHGSPAVFILSRQTLETLLYYHWKIIQYVLISSKIHKKTSKYLLLLFNHAFHFQNLLNWRYLESTRISISGFFKILVWNVSNVFLFMGLVCFFCQMILCFTFAIDR